MARRAAPTPDLADMMEAARLTRAGRLQDAAALVQRSLSGKDAASEPDPDTHAAILPGKVREVLGQVARGLRGVAPSIKGLNGQGFAGQGFGGFMLHGHGPQEPPDDATLDPTRFAEHSFSNEAGSRAYKLFIPSRRDGRRPLVVMLHGCTQSPDDFAAGTRMNALAEAEGIYVAYPRQTRGANAQKCWNWYEPRDQGRAMGEAGIIAGITRAVMDAHDIDPKRVYIAGLSAGGAAAANVARAYPDLYAALGVHSGLAAGCARDLSSALMAMNTGAPGGPVPGGASGFGADGEASRVPTIVFHGDGDRTVNPRNGEAVLAQAGIADLRAEAETSEDAASHPYTRTRYRDASGRVQVESWRVAGAGHAWSGGSPAGSYTDPRGPDASRAMLAFFREHALGAGPRAR